jgi:predicted phosphoadenosine phosphosulfate sulfurtransferase
MPRIRKKQYGATNVYEAALERIRYCYKRFDNVVVSFSGGKDSTAVLNLTIEVAREIGRLPVHTIFVDEEAIHPTTVEYVERVRHNPDVRLDWYCLPVKHRNACSNEQPFWYCWNPDERELWVREMPLCGISHHEQFRFGDSFQDWMPRMFPTSVGSVCVLTGIRTQESLRRFRVIATKKNDAFLTTKAEHGNSYRAFPIYDWSSEDVWKLVEEKGYDYNHTYDIFNKTKLYNKLLTQRVCPPYGEEPLRGLWVYAECFPDMWHKMLGRVKGVGTAWRYANTELYSNWQKPDNLTWHQYCKMVLETYTEPEYRNMVAENINGMIRYHYNKTNDPIRDQEAHPLSGCSWKFLAKLAIKGDFKGRQTQQMLAEGEKILKKLGMTLEEAVDLYGKDRGTTNRNRSLDSSKRIKVERLQPEQSSSTGNEAA